MKQIIKLAGTLFIITAVVAAVLSGVNSVTEGRIAAMAEQKKQSAMAQVLPEGKNLQNIEFTDESGIVQEVFAPDADVLSGQYAMKVTPSGFGGEIILMVGIQDGTVTGVAVVSNSETPSLGAVAGENSSKGSAFRDQFIGMEGPLAVTKDGGQVDAITSATITSRAVTKGVDAALQCAKALG